MIYCLQYGEPEKLVVFVQVQNPGNQKTNGINRNPRIGKDEMKWHDLTQLNQWGRGGKGQISFFNFLI